jgi:succinate-semialdehyde dehydrogenase/glutarate-semialdehyde dehydrogenase
MDMKTSPLALLKDPTLLKTDALINGQWLPGASRFDVHDPSNGVKLADVANLGPVKPKRPLPPPTPPGRPGAPKPARSAASSCANGLTC